MSRAPLDLAGKKFGALRVLSRTGTNDKGAALWEVHCDRCGAESIMISYRITHAKDCGCSSRERKADLSGQDFGFLHVLERAGSSKSGDALYKCRCSLCGSETLIPACSLRSGQKSCGCYINYEARREAAIKGGAQKSNPCVTEKWRETMKRTGKYDELSIRINKERQEKIHVQGTNIPAVKRKEPCANNKSGYRGVYMLMRRGKRKFKGRVQIQGEVRYTREFSNAEEAKKARDQLQEEMIREHNLTDLIFGGE